MAREDDIARESADDPTGWFEKLYVAAAAGEAEVPWDRGAPNPLLVEWAEARNLDGAGRRAVVVGCGLGRDAEYIASRGFATTAFDISPTAVDGARRRHPQTLVRYVVADLFAVPGDIGNADFVLESYTVQALPLSLRASATVHVGQLVKPGGTLLVVSVARPDHSDPGEGPPWPLSRAELDAFGSGDLRPVRVEEIPDPVEEDLHRFRAEFTRAASDPPSA